jgi:hypothetical protein
VNRLAPQATGVELSELAWLTLLIVVAMLLSAAFYVSMSRRDAVMVLADRVARRAHWSPWTRRLVGMLAVLVVTPLLVALWAATLFVLLGVLEPEDRLDEVAPLAAAIVAATRIFAYTAPGIAQELAKIVPMAFIVLLLMGSFGEIGPSAQPVTIELTLEGEDLVVLLALVVLELALRAGSIAVRALRGQGSGTATRSDASG